LVGIELVGFIFWFEDHWYLVVDWVDEVVWFCGDDCAAVEYFVVVVLFEFCLDFCECEYF